VDVCVRGFVKSCMYGTKRSAERSRVNSHVTATGNARGVQAATATRHAGDALLETQREMGEPPCYPCAAPSRPDLEGLDGTEGRQLRAKPLDGDALLDVVQVELRLRHPQWDNRARYANDSPDWVISRV